jgi:hypothetical protein
MVGFRRINPSHHTMNFYYAFDRTPWHDRRHHCRTSNIQVGCMIGSLELDFHSGARLINSMTAFSERPVSITILPNDNITH